MLKRGKFEWSDSLLMFPRLEQTPVEKLVARLERLETFAADSRQFIEALRRKESSLEGLHRRVFN